MIMTRTIPAIKEPVMRLEGMFETYEKTAVSMTIAARNADLATAP
jgi:hypothetical protein